MRQGFFKSGYFHLILFILTLITTTVAGTEFITGKSIFIGLGSELQTSDFYQGLFYSIPFLLIFSAHEFGHYFAAKFHKVKTTLPYYIPFYLGFFMPFSIGTLGAVIRIKELITSRKVYFDVGIAGPIAGFVVALFVLAYGFTHLPPKSYIYSIHPDYEKFGEDYEKFAYNPKVLRFQDSLKYVEKLRKDSSSASLPGNNRESVNSPDEHPQFQGGGVLLFSLGDNLLFYFFKTFVADQNLLPNKYEMMHFPFLLVGYLALFFTALNLLPIGQLDGGHITYGLLGNKNHRIVSAVIFFLLVLYGGLGIINLKEIIKSPFENLVIYTPLYIGFLYFLFSRVTSEQKNNLLLAVVVFTLQFLISYLFPEYKGNPFWLFWAFILSRFLGIYHPPTFYDEPLDLKRKILGWISLIIFIICFSPEPFVLEELYY